MVVRRLPHDNFIIIPQSHKSVKQFCSLFPFLLRILTAFSVDFHFYNTSFRAFSLSVLQISKPQSLVILYLSTRLTQAIGLRLLVCCTNGQYQILTTAFRCVCQSERGNGSIKRHHDGFFRQRLDCVKHELTVHSNL